jgi:hypothetical protein
MKNAFASALLHEGIKTTTTNGDLAYSTTQSPLLDLYSRIGSARDMDVSNKQLMFDYAFEEDSLMATKMLFFIRDIRGGMGERNTFRELLVHAAKTHPEIVIKNLELISEYGRWDDLFELFNTPVQKEMLDLVVAQLIKDLNTKEGEPISLLAKWIPSNNTSSKETVEKANLIQKHLGITPREYRKMLSALRKRLNVVETKMSSNDWNTITYSTVCSRSHMIYRKAFNKHDKARYDEYKELVKKGEVNINASGIMPYEIINKLQSDPSLNELLELQWDKMPSLTDGFKALAIADVSASMTFKLPKTKATGLDVSIAMSMYLAQKNNGPFKDIVLTFSDKPAIVDISKGTLYQKYIAVERSNWSGSTNIEAAFNKILQIAIDNEVSQDDMIDTLFIFSDMQFNQCVNGANVSNYTSAKNKFEAAGYKLPKVIFWNLSGEYNNSPTTKDENNTVLISGFSAELFKFVTKGETPYESMITALNSDRYSNIRI